MVLCEVDLFENFESWKRQQRHLAFKQKRFNPGFESYAKLNVKDIWVRTLKKTRIEIALKIICVDSTFR